MIIVALKTVELWPIIEAHSSLDTSATSQPLFHRQYRTFSLVIEIFSWTNILMLDRPTSSVDIETKKGTERVVKAKS